MAQETKKINRDDLTRLARKSIGKGNKMLDWDLVLDPKGAAALSLQVYNRKTKAIESKTVNLHTATA